MTLELVIALVISIASFLGAIIVIWNFTEKLNKALEDKVRKIVQEVVESSNKMQDEKLDLKLEKQSVQFLNEINNVESKLDEHMINQQLADRRRDEQHNIANHAILETYKQDIRSIYYKLRTTGEITDAEKSYIDKIYPYYALLGGNSDIGAKMTEINEVYSEVTKENYAKKRRNRKDKTTDKE